MIVSLPVIFVLKRTFPEAHVIVIASKSNACIAQSSPFISETIVKNTKIGWIACLAKLRLRNISLAVDLNHSVAPHAILAMVMIGAKYSASPYKDGRWGISGTEIKLFDIMPPKHTSGYRRPISELYLDVAREMGCSTEGCYPYPLPKFPKPVAISSDYIILNWSGSKSSMRFSRDDLLLIANSISRHPKKKQILVPCQHADQKFLLSAFSGISNAKLIGPFDNICTFLPIIQHARLVITPDTSLVHLASAYRVPLIAIYTNASDLFEQWRPINLSDCITIHAHSEKSINDFPRDKLVEAIEQMLS